MLYLSGARNPHNAEYIDSGEIGLLYTLASGYRLKGAAVWAMDNGCFANKYPGDDAYLRALDSLEEHRDRCLFVAARDVVGDADATLAFLPGASEAIRGKGWPVALVGQDGMEALDIPWGLCDWLFVGGSTEWKLGPGARLLVERAQAAGKKVHVGRVNSWKRYSIFAKLGCDTADGTLLAFNPPMAQAVARWPERFRATKQLLLDL
jgi:hypothetical protein